MSLHICAAPPVTGAKIWLSWEQLGQTNPLMFSTTPSTRVPVFSQNLISLRTSAKATSCGVVTMTAPRRFVLAKYYMTEMCSSEVPGGVSTIK